LRFRDALIAQNVDRNTLVFKSKWQPYTAWFALIYFSIIIVFNGFAVFIKGNWTVGDFLTAYINIPIFAVLFIFWKVLKRTKYVRASEADIWSGKHAVDNEVWPDQHPRNVWERIWFWIA
jgi:amino acid transporter